MFSTIRTKLIAIFIILGVIPILIVGYLSYQSASNALLFQAQEQLGNVADKTAQQIDNFFEEAQKDIELLSKFPFIQLSFLQFEFGQSSDTIREMLKNYEKKNLYFNRIYLINSDGKKILAEPETPDNATSEFQSFDWFKATFEKGMYLSELKIGDGFSDPTIILSKLVYDFEDHTKVVGMLVFDIKLSALTRFVSSLKFGAQGYAFLLDKDEYLLYHPFHNLLPAKDIIQSGDLKLKQLMERIKVGEKGSGDYLLGGIEKNMVFTPCRLKNWSVVITVQKSDLMVDILKLKHRMITFVSMIVALILAVSFLFVKSITRPIGQLITGARAIGNGDLYPLIEIKSGDELQGLAREFNNMSVKLQRSMNEIMELTRFNDDVLRSVTSGIITIDREGRITSINKSAEKILGLARKETHSDCLEDAPIQVKEIMTLLQHTLLDQKEIQNQEIHFLSESEGETVFMEVNTSLLRNVSGEIIGAIADIRDITRRKRIEEQMVRVDKLASLGELSAGMAHEIRNPLSGMKTSAQFLATKLTTGSESILLQGILSEIDRINKIVTDLLNFSRPKPPFPALIDTTVILEKVLSMVTEKIRKSRIELIRKYEENTPMALIDKEQIQQVFLNLLLNAVKAMPGGGNLTVSIGTISGRSRVLENIPDPDASNLSESTRLIAISFRDSGQGISQNELKKVFNPFYTTDPSGTGLGLSIVQKLLEKNGGYIKMDSMPGKGTQVTLLLPAASPGSGLKEISASC
jgi:PAS domain S-box-containing protein